ncbi:MAG: septation protein SepH [Pseudonocardiaceae bacterium]
MRALRVVGLGADGRTVILETVEQQSGEQRERFTVPADDSLHAAVRGDLPRLGQIEIELESQMRPREIQARIRAGASVEQVATAAGVSSQRIERFAYPVLLERSRIAGLAQQAHPIRSDGPDVRTLEGVVAETFRQRGHDLEAVTWDSWRGEDGKWVIQLRWRAGRSENRAHWTFHPGAHGGTVTAIDDHATGLIDPQPAAQLRTVPLVTQPGQQVAQVVEQRPSARAVPDDGPAYHPAQPPPEPSETPQPGPPKRARKTIPSWEDVLLGVRSPRT